MDDREGAVRSDEPLLLGRQHTRRARPVACFAKGHSGEEAFCSAWVKWSQSGLMRWDSSKEIQCGKDEAGVGAGLRRETENELREGIQDAKTHLWRSMSSSTRVSTPSD